VLPAAGKTAGLANTSPALRTGIARPYNPRRPAVAIMPATSGIGWEQPESPRAFTKLWPSISSYFTLNRHASHKCRRFLNQKLLLLFWLRKIVRPQNHYFALNAGASAIAANIPLEDS